MHTVEAHSCRGFFHEVALSVFLCLIDSWACGLLAASLENNKHHGLLLSPRPSIQASSYSSTNCPLLRSPRPYFSSHLLFVSLLARSPTSLTLARYSPPPSLPFSLLPLPLPSSVFSLSSSFQFRFLFLALFPVPFISGASVRYKEIGCW